MKEEGEDSLANHDSRLAQPASNSSSSSPESHWEEGQEIIPTFFSTMNTRYSILSKISDNWIPASLLENQGGVPFR